MCSSRTPRPKEGNRNSEGGPRGGNFKGGGGGFLRSFFLGLQVRLEGYLRNNSFSVEQALSYHFYCQRSFKRTIGHLHDGVILLLLPESFGVMDIDSGHPEEITGH